MIPLPCLVLSTLFSSRSKGQIEKGLSGPFNQLFLGTAHAVFKSKKQTQVGYDGRAVACGAVAAKAHPPLHLTVGKL